MLIRVDPASGVPLFAQLAASVRAEIVRGSLTAGDRLPAARDLADSLDINIHTVLRAYQDLRDEGLIELRRGRGAIVSANAAIPGPIVGAAATLVAEARRSGVSLESLTALIRQEYSA